MTGLKAVVPQLTSQRHPAKLKSSNKPENPIMCKQEGDGIAGAAKRYHSDHGSALSEIQSKSHQVRSTSHCSIAEGNEAKIDAGSDENRKLGIRACLSCPLSHRHAGVDYICLKGREKCQASAYTEKMVIIVGWCCSEVAETFSKSIATKVPRCRCPCSASGRRALTWRMYPDNKGYK